MTVNIHWQDRVANKEVLDRACSTSIEALLLKAQMRWTSHVIPMDGNRVPIQVMYGELEEKGHANWDAQKLRYKDTLNRNLKWSGIQPQQLQACASDRSKWKFITSMAIMAFDEEVQNTNIQCYNCGRPCASSFGLRRHMRSHRWQHRLRQHGLPIDFWESERESEREREREREREAKRQRENEKLRERERERKRERKREKEREREREKQIWNKNFEKKFEKKKILKKFFEKKKFWKIFFFEKSWSPSERSKVKSKRSITMKIAK